MVLCPNMCMNCTPLFKTFSFLCFLKILFKIWIYAIAVLAARNNKCPISSFRVLFNSTNTSKHMLQICKNRKIYPSFLANKQTDMKCIGITQKTNRKAAFSINKATCPPVDGSWSGCTVYLRYLWHTSPSCFLIICLNKSVKLCSATRQNNVTIKNAQNFIQTIQILYNISACCFSLLIYRAKANCRTNIIKNLLVTCTLCNHKAQVSTGSLDNRAVTSPLCGECYGKAIAPSHIPTNHS